MKAKTRRILKPALTSSFCDSLPFFLAGSLLYGYPKMLKYLIQKEAKISVDGVYDCCNINPKWTPKWIRKDTKMEPKRTKNGPKRT